MRLEKFQNNWRPPAYRVGRALARRTKQLAHMAICGLELGVRYFRDCAKCTKILVFKWKNLCRFIVEKFSGLAVPTRPAQNMGNKDARYTAYCVIKKCQLLDKMTRRPAAGVFRPPARLNKLKCAKKELIVHN